MPKSKLLEEMRKLAARDNITLGDLDDHNTVIICGAGISIESKLPSGWDLIKKVLDTFDLGHGCSIDLVKQFENYNDEVIATIQGYKVKLYDAPRLEVLFKCAKDVLSADEYHLMVQALLYYNYKEEVYNKQLFSNYQHFAIANFIRSGGLVLTANFDHLIEHALEELDKGYAYNKISFPYHVPQAIDTTTGSLVKYHGDINHINSIGIDISNLNINGFSRQETVLLDLLLQQVSNVIFIGFSVSDTLDLIPYLKSRAQEATFFFFNFTAVGHSGMKKYVPTNKGNRIEAYEYFYLKNPHTYVVNNYFNEIQRKANPFPSAYANTPAFELTDTHIAAMEKLMAMLSDKESEIHVTIKMNILKTYGLLNWVEEADLSRLTGHWRQEIVGYWQNIKGNYRYNYYQLIRNQEQERFAFKKFGALQEYVFLQKKFVFDRMVKYLFLTVQFCRFYHQLKKEQKDISVELKLNRSVCLYMLRIFQVFFKRKLIKLIPKVVLNKYESLVQRQIQIARQLNDLSIYKFALKEHLYIKGFFSSRLDIAKSDLEQELINLYELNIDTNYFIEANNLLRFGATVISPEVFTAPFILSAKITNDELNLKKVIKHTA